MPHKTSFDAAIAASASKFTLGSAAVGSAASVFSVEWLTLIGIGTALISFAVQMFFSVRQWQRNRKEDVLRDREEARREKEHVAYLQALKEGKVSPPVRGAAHER